MTKSDGFGRRAYAARLAQRLAGPSEALVGYQELIVDEIREAGPAEALDDLEKVLEAARSLARLVDGLVSSGGPSVPDLKAEAQLRHDLRTPINAILGYSEMVAEDFAGALPSSVVGDMSTIVAEARNVLGLIDAIVDRVAPDASSAREDEADLSIAAELAQTIAHEPAKSEMLTGRILVVDDLENNRDLMARRLRRDGHWVETAESGTAALELLVSTEIDVALLDIMMPDINGIELLRRIKGDQKFRDIAVLMVSGLKETDAVLRCIAAGAEDYLPKPVDSVLLRARLEACLERRRWRAREQSYLVRIRAEKERADALLDAILPTEVVRRLAAGEAIIADRFDEATIVFADIVDFTSMAARTAPSALLKQLGALFGRFDEIAEAHGIEKIKTIGDAYMAAAGVPRPREDHAEAAIGFARAIISEADRPIGIIPKLRLRIGIHSGPVVAGLIGRKRFLYDIWGHTVNIASRLENHSPPGRIQISESTFDALGRTMAVDPQQILDLKGVGRVQTYLISD